MNFVEIAMFSMIERTASLKDPELIAMYAKSWDVEYPETLMAFVAAFASAYASRGRLFPSVKC